MSNEVLYLVSNLLVIYSISLIKNLNVINHYIVRTLYIQIHPIFFSFFIFLKIWYLVRGSISPKDQSHSPPAEDHLN